MKQVKIELRSRRNAEDRPIAITAVWRPESEATKWAQEKNAKLDFYGPECWVITKITKG